MQTSGKARLPYLSGQVMKSTSSVNHNHTYHSKTRECAFLNNSCNAQYQYFSSAAAQVEEDNELANNYTIKRRHGVRNVAIVAHVDHGKTTLVDELLKVAAASTSTSAKNASGDGNPDDEEVDLDRLMDSGDLEKERGITITSKVTRLDYTTSDGSEDYVINVVDTPGRSI